MKRFAALSAICAVLLLAVIRQVHAAAGETSQDFGAYRVASNFLPHAFPTKPMKTGEWDLKVIPGYFIYHHTKDLPLTDSSDSRDQKLTGAGLAFAANYTAFENDWGYFGMGIFGEYFKGDGSRLALTATAPGLPALGFYGGDTARGGLVAYSLNYDPFKSPDGFRLPMMIGVSYTSISEFARADAGLSAAYGPLGAGTYRMTTDINTHTAGFMTGISPQFNAGSWFRLSPFVMVSMPFKNTDDHGTLTYLNTGAVMPAHTNPAKDPIAAVGIELTYKPWNLGTLIVPPIPLVSQGASVYSLKLAKSFGG